MSATLFVRSLIMMVAKIQSPNAAAAGLPGGRRGAPPRGAAMPNRAAAFGRLTGEPQWQFAVPVRGGFAAPPGQRGSAATKVPGKQRVGCAAAGSAPGSAAFHAARSGPQYDTPTCNPPCALGLTVIFNNVRSNTLFG